MSEQRVLGEVKSIGDYHAIARARADELALTREGLDRLAGFASGHASKMLSQVPLKRIGPASFGTLNTALGLKLLVVEDPEALQAHAKLRAANQRLRPVQEADDLITMSALRARVLRRMGQKGARVRNTKLSPEDRSRISREAAQARWARLDAAGRKEAMRPLAKGYRAHVAHRRKCARARTHKSSLIGAA